MKKKIVWLVVSCLMVLSLVMASCGPAGYVTFYQYPSYHS